MSNKKSRAIKNISFNPKREDLTIKFKSNREYVYTPVPEEVEVEFKNSSSKGEFFNKNIKDNPLYTCLKKL